MIDIPKSPDLQSQQIQEMARSAPDPFPLFGGGVWVRDYQKEGKGLAHFEPFLVFADSAGQVILECRSRAQSRIPIKKSR